MTERPSIDEHDTGSYLDGSISPHRVLALSEAGVQADGQPDFEVDGWSAAPTLCREHAYELMRSLGYVGPVPLPTSYQRHLTPDIEPIMMKFDNDGHLTHVAEYAYGRAYFGPGEPRTALCSICGVETLIDTLKS